MDLKNCRKISIYDILYGDIDRYDVLWRYVHYPKKDTHVTLKNVSLLSIGKIIDVTSDGFVIRSDYLSDSILATKEIRKYVIIDEGLTSFCEYGEKQRKWLIDNKVRMGDFLRVAKSCKDRQDGWESDWVPEMDWYVGKVFRFQQISDLCGLTQDPYKYPWFPFFCLEKVEYEPFDFSTVESKNALRGKWITNRENNVEICVSYFNRSFDSKEWYCENKTAKELFDSWSIMEDGRPAYPCGMEIIRNKCSI